MTAPPEPRPSCLPGVLMAIAAGVFLASLAALVWLAVNPFTPNPDSAPAVRRDPLPLFTPTIPATTAAGTGRHLKERDTR